MMAMLASEFSSWCAELVLETPQAHSRGRQGLKPKRPSEATLREKEVVPNPADSLNKE
jgi:hypothetical protein